MGTYFLKDIKSAFEYAKNNPNSNIYDWVEYTNQNINEEEIKLYEDIKYCDYKFKFNDQSYDLMILNIDNIHLVDNITQKVVGNREYYQLIPLPGEFYSPIISILSFDQNLLTLNMWKEHDTFKGVKYIDDGNITLMFNLSSDYWDELTFKKWNYYQKHLEKNNLSLWDTNSVLRAYIKNINKIEFKPIVEMFKKL